jgi:hypothetical protein
MKSSLNKVKWVHTAFILQTDKTEQSLLNLDAVINETKGVRKLYSTNTVTMWVYWNIFCVRKVSNIVIPCKHGHNQFDVRYLLRLSLYVCIYTLAYTATYSVLPWLIQFFFLFSLILHLYSLLLSFSIQIFLYFSRPLLYSTWLPFHDVYSNVYVTKVLNSDRRMNVTWLFVQ